MRWSRFWARPLALCLCAALISGCDGTRLEDRSCQYSRWEAQDPPSSEFAFGYFPASYAEPRPVCGGYKRPFIGEVESGWYPKALHAACEGPLHETPATMQAGERILRLSVLPSFRPSIFVTVTKNADNYRGVVKEMVGTGGDSYGIIGRSKDFAVSRQEGAALENLLQAAEQEFNAEQARFAAETEQTCFNSFDGTTWLIEVADADGYRLIKAKSPSSGGRFHLGQALMSATGWEFED